MKIQKVYAELLQAQSNFLKKAIKANCSKFDACYLLPLLERGRVSQLININLKDFQALFCFEISYFNFIEDSGEDFQEFLWIYQESMAYTEAHILLAPTIMALETEIEIFENFQSKLEGIYDYPGSSLVSDFKYQLTKHMNHWQHLLPMSQITLEQPSSEITEEAWID